MDINKQLEKLTTEVSNLANQISRQESRLKKLEKSANVEPLSPAQLSKESPPEIEPYEKDIQKKNELKGESIESEIGMKWLGRVGVIALVFGVAFFLKYAFDNNWIGEIGRVIMGIVGGLALIGLGEYFKEKYLTYAKVLCGGGIAILYLSVYVSFGFYELITQVPAFAFMAMVTFVSGALAIHYEGEEIAVMGILGGFLTPFLLSTGANIQGLLFTYLIILTLGIFGISFFRKWRALNLLAFCGTGIVFLNWFVQFYTKAQLFSTELFLVIFFVIFAIATISHNLINKEKSDTFDVSLVLLNALVFFGASYHILNPQYSQYMGFFAVGMAIIYFALTYFSFSINKEDTQLAFILAGLSVFFLTIAVPIQFEGKWITIAWLVESAILIGISLSMDNLVMRVMGWIVCIIAMVKLFAFESFVKNLKDYTIIFNERVFVFLMAIVSLAVINYLYSVYQANIKEYEKGIRVFALIALNFVIIFIMSAESIAYFDQKMLNLQVESPTCQRQVYQDGKLVTSDYCENQYKAYTEKMASNRAEIRDIRDTSNVVLSVIWTLYAVLLLGLGIGMRNKVLRIMGMGLLAISIFKIFLYDLWGLGTLYRIISSMTLGVLLLLASFAYNKYKDRIKEII